MMSTQPTYAVAVRQDRKRAKLTLRELARRVGVDYTYLSKIENAKYVPSAATAQRIAEEVGANPASHLRALGWYTCPRCRYFHRLGAFHDSRCGGRLARR